MRVFIFQSYLAATVMSLAKTLVSIENDFANVRHDSRELEMYRRTLRQQLTFGCFPITSEQQRSLLT